MRRSVALSALVVASLALLLSHVSVERHDHAYLVNVDGRLHDPVGLLRDRWNGLQRNCTGVASVAAGSPLWAAAEQAVQRHSPPDSISGRLQQLWQSPGWLAAEVSFEQLAPVVVLLRTDGSVPAVDEQGLWSGATWPWRPGPFIRDFLATRVPQAPSGLLACVDPLVTRFER